MWHRWLLLWFVPLLLLGACTDVPRYTADQVVTVAKSYSPECTVPGMGIGLSSTRAQHFEPSFAVEYLGDGIWLVTKTCRNSHYNGRWYFYEDTGKFVAR